MDQATFNEIMALVQAGAHYVELDTMVNQPSPNPGIAGQNAIRAAESWDDGEAVVFLYSRERDAELAPSGHRQWVRQLGCNREQSIAFLQAGATWVGLPHYNPLTNA